MCGFNYRFVPGRPARARAARGGRARRRSSTSGRATSSRGAWDAPPSWRFDRAQAGIGRDRRPRRAHRRPRPLPRRRAGGDQRGHEDVRRGTRGRRRLRGHGRVRRTASIGTLEASRLARGRINQNTFEVNGSRGLALVRRRAPRTSCRSRTASGSSASSLPSPSIRSCAAGGRRATSSAGATPSRTRCTTCCRRSPARHGVAPHGATFEDGYRCAEVCDAIVRSSETGAARGDRVRGGARMKTSLGIWAFGSMVDPVRARRLPAAARRRVDRRARAPRGRRARRPDRRLRVPLPAGAERGEPRRGPRRARRPRHLLHRDRAPPRPALRPRRPRLARRRDPRRGAAPNPRRRRLRRLARRALHHLAGDRGLQLPVPDAVRGELGLARRGHRRGGRAVRASTASTSSSSTRTRSRR